MKLSQEQTDFLSRKQYLRNNETITQRIDSILEVVKSYEKQYKQEGLSERLKKWINNKYISLSTPQLANVGREKTGNTQALPCSCNILSVNNSIDGIYSSMHEVAMLSKLGAGVGGSLLNVADGGTKIEEGFHTNPKTDWVEDLVRTSKKVSQNAVRRGYFVPFDSIESSEFWNYIERLDKNNPDKKDPLVKNNFGFILETGFWDRMKDSSELQKRIITVIQIREATGKVYMLDVENCNKNLSPVYKNLGHVVNTTNICTEVLSPSYTDKTFACIILSLNLSFADIILRNPQIVEDAYILLDIFTQLYIDLSEGVSGLEKARKSAIEKRDIGLGTLGYHDYIQSKGWAFGGLQSRFFNKKIYKFIREIGEKTTKKLAEDTGAPKMCQEAGLMRRNVSLMMVAPNKSTAFFMGTSEGISPYMSNYFVDKLAGVERTFKNPHLEKLLEFEGKNTFETWSSILENLGSVQHLDFLSDDQKSVFKTASEISPKDIIDLAHDRQEFIDMAQSINLFGRPNYTTQDVYNIHKYAFVEKDIKTLYYYYPQAHAALEKEGESWDTCESCAD